MAQKLLPEQNLLPRPPMATARAACVTEGNDQMKSVRALVVAAVLGVVAIGAHATPITLGNFNGSESLIDFNSQAAGTFAGSFTSQGVTLVPESGSYMFQPGSGFILGTTGTAFNTFNSISSIGVGDVTLLFSNAVSRFGVNFGTLNMLGGLSAEVRAYDAGGNLIESASFPSFGNTFVGFDFTAPVSKVVIDRTDSADLFTFIDDVRFVTAAVPEPASLALAGVAAFAAGAMRRRRR